MRKIFLAGILASSVCVAQDHAPTASEIDAMAAMLKTDLRGAEDTEQVRASPARTLPQRTGGPVSVAQLRHELTHKPKKAAQSAFARGLKLSGAGDHRGAAEEFEKAAAADAEFANAFDRLGVEYAQLGRYGEAEAELRRSLALDSSSWVSHFDLGVMLYQLGDLDGAERSVRRAQELSKTNVQVNALLGILLWRNPESRAEGLRHLHFAAGSSAEARELLASLERQ